MILTGGAECVFVLVATGATVVGGERGTVRASAVPIGQSDQVYRFHRGDVTMDDQVPSQERPTTTCYQLGCHSTLLVSARHESADYRTFEGSLSAVSTPSFATKGSCFRIFKLINVDDKGFADRSNEDVDAWS